MSKVKNTKNKIKSKVEAIKKINDDPKVAFDNVYDKYLKDLPSTDELFGKKLDDFLDKRKKKKENNKDIFSELIDIVDGFISTNSTQSIDSDKFITKQKVKQYAMDSAKVTTESLKDIVSTNTKKIFFSDEGICGGNSLISIDSINIKPKEIDFLNMLTVDPDSNMGKIMYEPQSPNINKEKVNRKLYQTFSPSSYQFDSNNNNTLFTINWNSANQHFVVSGLTQGSSNIKVEDFFNDYYSSIEFPDITGITKTAMLMTIQGDGSETEVFNRSFNDLQRLIKKLFAVCGTQTQRDNLNKQNALDLFDENDEDIEYYFNFDDVEGIDLDDEDTRLRKVMKFRDCNNFEIPVNTDIIEDFVYLTDKKTINDLVNTTLSRTASDAFEQSDGNIPLANFNLSLINTYILNIPKALVSSIITPKIFLPIVVIYKLFKSLVSQVLEIKDLMKKLYKLFSAIIKEVFWKFITEFWKRIKPELINFIRRLITKILKNKYKRYVTIITSLIALLSRILQSNLNNCADLFNTILNTINGALSAKGGFNIPGLLLGFSDALPGYSQDRAFLNITERLEAAGIPTGPINGESNDLLSAIKSMLDGQTEEMDTNSFIKVSNKEITIPTPFGPLIVPPGILNSSGKIF